MLQEKHQTEVEAEPRKLPCSASPLLGCRTTLVLPIRSQRVTQRTPALTRLFREIALIWVAAALKAAWDSLRMRLRDYLKSIRLCLHTMLQESSEPLLHWVIGTFDETLSSPNINDIKVVGDWCLFGLLTFQIALD